MIEHMTEFLSAFRAPQGLESMFEGLRGAGLGGTGLGGTGLGGTGLGGTGFRSAIESAVEVQRAALVDFDASFVYHLVLFILLVFVLNAVIFKPLLRVEELRHQKTQGAIEQAETAQIEAQKRVAEYELAVNETRKRGSDDFHTRREEASKQAAAAIDAARQASDAKLSEANRALTQRYELARKEIQVKAKELSERIADKVLGAKG